MLKEVHHIRLWMLAALLLAALPLLGGCASQMEERAMADLSQMPIEAGVLAPQQDGAADTRMLATLYFLDAKGQMLCPTVREVQVSGGESRTQAALDALLSGPLEHETEVYWPELGGVRSARLLEVSSGIAVVDLPAHARTLNQEMLFAVRAAITATLTEFSEISYVNVLIGGREEGLDLSATLPVGTMTREEDLNVKASYDRLYEQRLSQQGITLLTTLYFPSADGRWILPQVRSISYAEVSPIEYLYTLLEEIGSGANDELAAEQIPAPMDYIEEMPEIVRTEDGYLAIELRLNDMLDDDLELAGLSRGAYLAMLAETLLGFVPGVEGLRVYVGSNLLAGLDERDTPDGQEIEFAQGIIQRSDFDGYVGAPITLYAMDEGRSGLVRLKRTIDQVQQLQPRARLLALLELNGEGIFALPDGVSGQDVLAVYTGENEIVLNLSDAFADALSKLEPDQERAAIYAMVNTLTEGMDAARVSFFFDGVQEQALAGALEMRGAFVRNPGMVVN